MNSIKPELKKSNYIDAQKKAYKKYLEKNKENINKKQREKNKLKKENPEYKDKIKKYTESHKEKLKNGTVKKRAPNPTTDFIIAEKQNLKFMNKILNNITKQKNALEIAQQNTPLINNKDKIRENENIISMLLLNMKDNFKNDIKQLENRAGALEYKTSKPIKYLLTDEQNAIYNDTLKTNEEKQRDAPFNALGTFDPNQWQQSGENNLSNNFDLPYGGAFNDVENIEEQEADTPQQPIFYVE